jgi:hypothetical protein
MAKPSRDDAERSDEEERLMAKPSRDDAVGAPPSRAAARGTQR